jgi:hypothetical protein
LKRQHGGKGEARSFPLSFTANLEPHKNDLLALDGTVRSLSITWIEDQMSIVYEYATCSLVALCGGTLLFTLSTMSVMLWTVGKLTWRWSRELAPIPNRLLASWTSEIHLP